MGWYSSHLRVLNQLGLLLLEIIIFTKLNLGEMWIVLIERLLYKGKDATQCSHYRPLSLILNCFPKCWKPHLKTYLPKLFHIDTILGGLLHILHASSETTVHWAVLPLNAEKSFNRLEWSYLWSVLEHINYINLIKMLYANPSAIIITGNICSVPFRITRSSRQGDPTVSLIFSLSMDPLAQAVCQSKENNTFPQNLLIT
jgi:hypothetical protein